MKPMGFLLGSLDRFFIGSTSVLRFYESPGFLVNV